jgi:hypothetical protein
MLPFSLTKYSAVLWKWKDILEITINLEGLLCEAAWSSSANVWRAAGEFRAPSETNSTINLQRRLSL